MSGNKGMGVHALKGTPGKLEKDKYKFIMTYFS